MGWRTKWGSPRLLKGKQDKLKWDRFPGSSDKVGSKLAMVVASSSLRLSFFFVPLKQ